ncbi:MAG: SRPBCC family protein [Actinomycetota bacterium]
MTAIVESIDISRRPEDVFLYATDFSHFPEWQLGVRSVRREGDTPLAVGARATVIRQAGPRKLSRTEQIPSSIRRAVGRCAVLVDRSQLSPGARLSRSTTASDRA